MKLKLSELTKTYRDANRELAIVNKVNFDFPESSSVAIVGRSGVGKSTLLNLLAGLDTPSSGAVFYDDTNLSILSSDKRAAFRARNVGFVFQFHHLLPEFSAVENVEMPLVIAGVDSDKARVKAELLLSRVGLSSRLGHRPGMLSGGEQQRVAIARALVSDPGVVFADEPTGNLDVSTAYEIQQLLIEVNRELKNLLIVVTHSRELAASLDYAYEMLSGGELKLIAERSQDAHQESV